MNLSDLADTATFRVAACDLNGQMRGKRMPGGSASKLAKGGVRLPLSALNVDLWGEDIEDSPLVFESGDGDGVLLPTDRGPVPMPWLDTPSALVPMAMQTEDGAPFAGDPRHALATVLTRFAARGLRVIAATEMEFTLVDTSGAQPTPPLNPVSGHALRGPAILSMAELDAFDAFFTDLYTGAAAMGIPAETATCEAGRGQFEITLTHQDAMRAADDAWLFKTLVRGLARRHGFAATFMAKPYGDDAGNGMHVHFSLVDDGGRNVFDDGGSTGTDTLRAAVAGCLAAMPDSTLIFAPYGNSFDRIVPGAHAPVSAAWAYENRTVAIRIPGGAPAARRIEHRVAGGDVNPYLMLATVLGAALTGIEDGAMPPAPVTGNAYALEDLSRLAPTWADAIDRLAASTLMPRILPAMLIRNLVMTKRQEQRLMADLPPETRWLDLYEVA